MWSQGGVSDPGGCLVWGVCGPGGGPGGCLVWGGVWSQGRCLVCGDVVWGGVVWGCVVLGVSGLGLSDLGGVWSQGVWSWGVSGPGVSSLGGVWSRGVTPQIFFFIFLGSFLGGILFFWIFLKNFFLDFVFDLEFLFFWGSPPARSRLRHMVNERPVRILLECILVYLLKMLTGSP